MTHNTAAHFAGNTSASQAPQAQGAAMGMVIYVERVGDVIRIVSARKATKNEERRYEQASRTDWKRLASMKDQEIDTSDIAELGDDFFRNAKLRVPPKQAVTICLDADVLAWFKDQGQGYQTRIKQLLRMYMQAKQRR